MLFTKKPMQVEMIRWAGDLDSFDAVQSWGDALVENNDAIRSVSIHLAAEGGSLLRLWVEKSQSECSIKFDDWIALESDGTGYYPIAAEVQAATYEQPNAEWTGIETDDTAELVALNRCLKGGTITPEEGVNLCMWILKRAYRP